MISNYQIKGIEETMAAGENVDHCEIKDLIEAYKALREATRWRDIKGLVYDGRQVEYSSPAGIFIAPATKPEALPKEEQVDIIKKYGDWPNVKYNPTHYRELPTPPSNKRDV